ncbi:hypothetical protein THRCLA_09660 [Thraustotheca clavata]|uniref:WASH complex subunit CCDC53 n=1 Tax=Thraustotheca clavata TaxID=74557 RepID=A0A1V9YVL5_9STRA|nr:hypothetical protein THRCLA_09660 [Thraustotheca clavata]
MSLVPAADMPPPPPPEETALVVAKQETTEQEEESPVDLMQLPSIPMQKSLLLLTNFCSNTVRFINHFSNLCEERLSTISKNLTRLEISLAILEAKLNSIPDLPTAATISAADIPEDLPMPTDAPAPPPPPPAPPAGDGAPPPPPPPPPMPTDDGAPPPPPDASQETALAPSPSFLKLKDDPLYAKYFAMQRMGHPEGAILHKMKMDSVDPSILSMDPEGPSPSATSIVPVEAPSMELALTIAPPPPPSVHEDDDQSGPPPPPPMDFPPPPRAMESVPPPPMPAPFDPPAAPSAPPIPPVAPAAPEEPKSDFMKLKEDPMYSTYFKMQKMGLPEGAIRQKMAMNGITIDLLSMDPEGPSPNPRPVAKEDDNDDDF